MYVSQGTTQTPLQLIVPYAAQLVKLAVLLEPAVVLYALPTPSCSALPHLRLVCVFLDTTRIPQKRPVQSVIPPVSPAPEGQPLAV